MFKHLFIAMLAMSSTMSYAAEAEIIGQVQPKCSIHTDTPGIYGNPSPNRLSTDTADGGRPAIIRYDVVEASYYRAVITTPDSFTTSPALNDTVTWTGSVDVNEVTDAAMSAYDTNKRVFNNVTEIDLSVAGTVWFKANSTASYGYNKALPGGTYKAVVTAECVAQ